jgi:hypothetical protein
MKEQIVLPTDHFKRRVRNQYSQLDLAIPREVIQNSHDAGANRIEFCFTNHGFHATDNGNGINGIEKFREVYLTLGGSEKSDGAIGSFGAAKELLSLAWSRWYVKSQGFKVEGEAAAPPTSYAGADHGVETGFVIGAEDDTLDGLEIRYQLEKLVGLSRLPGIDVYSGFKNAKAERVPQGRTLRSNQKVKEFEFGTLYVHKSSPGPFEKPGQLYIRTRGLYTCSEHVGGDYVWYLVLDAPSTEVLTENRDSLRYTVKREVQKCVQDLDRGHQTETMGNPTLKVYTEKGWASESDGQGGWETKGSDGQLLDASHGESYHRYWRKPFAIANDTGKDISLTTASGNPRPSITKPLEVYSRALKMIVAAAGLEDEYLAGLYYGASAWAVFAPFAGHRVVALSPELIERSGYEIVDTIIHELAHKRYKYHNQDYECARSEIASKIGDSIIAIVSEVNRLRNEPAQRGRYWEN